MHMDVEDDEHDGVDPAVRNLAARRSTLVSVAVNIGLIALLSLLPIIVGTLLLSRPPVAKWFTPEPDPKPDV